MENNWLDLITTRRSVRTFQKGGCDKSLEERMLDFSGSLKPLFGSEFRFSIVSGERAEGKVGTYGTLKNPAFYLVGEGRSGDYHPADFGYIGEKALLMGQGSGLGSCWLGGTFSKSAIARSSGLREGYEIPSIIAFGVPSDKHHFGHYANRIISRADRRKHPDQLFRTVEGEPVDMMQEGSLARLLEAVLIAPSASNRQPWRVVVEDKTFHFFLRRNPGYTRLLKLGRLADLQMLDMGIALAHLELAADSLGFEHEWLDRAPEGGMESDWDYLISCRLS